MGEQSPTNSPPGRVRAVMPRWSLRFRVSRMAHLLVNRLAWKFAPPPGPTWGCGLRVDHSHPLWRLNDWLAAGWLDEYIDAAKARARADLPGQDQK